MYMQRQEERWLAVDTLWLSARTKVGREERRQEGEDEASLNPVLLAAHGQVFRKGSGGCVMHTVFNPKNWQHPRPNRLLSALACHVQLQFAGDCIHFDGFKIRIDSYRPRMQLSASRSS